MSKLRLTLACWDYDRTRPVLDGTVQAEGVDLAGTVMEPGKLFARMWKTGDFDVSELSLADYTIMTGRGQSPFIAVPIFPSRMFRHSCIYVHTKAGIARPEDLAGKQIGSPNYQMTAAVWARAMLHHDYGVLPESVEWFWGGQEAPGGSARIALDLPPGFSVSPIPEGKTLSSMLDAGELDALITPNFPSPFLAGSPNVARLFPESRPVEEDYFRRTGLFPIMHTIVLPARGLRGQPVGCVQSLRGVRRGEAAGLPGAVRDRRAEDHAAVGGFGGGGDAHAYGGGLLGVRGGGEPGAPRDVWGVPG